MFAKTILAVTACLAIAPIATAADSPPTAKPVPRRDSFHGRITSATGKLKRDPDRIQIKLRRTTGDRTAVTVTLAGRACHHRRRCSRIAGTLTGTMIRLASNPDTGEQFALTLHGHVRPLGHITARGTAHGTGFIAYGYESLHLTLANASARVTIDAQSGRVRGFTSP